MGLRIIEIPYQITKTQKRKHKKKRINKKWAKIYGFDIIKSHMLPDNYSCIHTQTNTLYCHPKVAYALKTNIPNMYKGNDN